FRRTPRSISSFPTRRSSDLATDPRRDLRQGLWLRARAREGRIRPAGVGPARAEPLARAGARRVDPAPRLARAADRGAPDGAAPPDRKSTRLNSSHGSSSYAV